MSKSLLAFVWIAGPLTGTLVQPYIGIRSDNCRLSWGKRKPFMVVGSAATVVSLLALAWVKEIVGGFLSIFGVDPASNGTRIVVIIMATIIMYSLDFAVNTGSSFFSSFSFLSNLLIIAYSASWDSCFHCGQLSRPPTGACQRLGEPGDWRWQHPGVHFRVFGLAQDLTVFGEYSVQGPVRHCLCITHRHASFELFLYSRARSQARWTTTFRRSWPHLLL